MVKCTCGVLALTAAFLTTVTAQDKRAVVVFAGPTVTGNITFIQERNKVTVLGKVMGLTKGYHGFHIHEKGDLSNGCASTGSHFNPDKKNHGSPQDRDRHIGDLGNIEANDQGVAYINITDERISLSSTKRNIIGRAVVIHSDPDDLGKGGEKDSLTTGHAGSRVACGVIGTITVNTNSAQPTTTTTVSIALILSITAYLL